MKTDLIGGFTTPAYSRVRDAFIENFEAGLEVGAALTVTYEGRPVVDLWGGVADVATRRPWESNTLQVIFSGTKALTALCLLILVDRGRLELEAPVSRYWPEFAQHGKQRISVQDLAAHRARLPGLRQPVSETQILDGIEMASMLAAQPVETDPRAAGAYHALTYGWLCGEMVRRIDGRSIGRFFEEEVARPLDLEVWIGLPSELEDRVSTLVYAPDWDAESLYKSDDELARRVWGNPPLFPADRLPSNRSDWHQAEIAAVGGIATARSVARLFGCLAMGGVLNGVRLLSESSLVRGRRPFERRVEPLLHEAQAFGVGFELQANGRTVFGPPADAFGHSGAGGSKHCAWPSQRIGISYVANQLRAGSSGAARSERLLQAIFRANQASGDPERL